MSLKDQSRWSLGAAKFIRRNATRLKTQLPDPGEVFTQTETDLDDGEWRILTYNERLLKRQNKKDEYDKYDETPGSSPGWAWTVPKDLHEVIERHATDDSITHPCAEKGHHGVRNLRDGGYSCQNDGCDVEFDRETARKLIESL